MAYMIDEFHQLLDSAPDAIIVVDREGNVAAVNIEAERFFGWSEREMLGLPLTRVVPRRLEHQFGSDLGTHRASRALAVPEATVSCVARRRDGSELPVELSRRPLGHGFLAQSLVTVRDRSEWSRAQGISSRNNEQARTTLESIGDSLVTTDTNFRGTYLNPVAERLTGWTADEARGQPLESVLPLIAEATREPIPNTAQRCLDEGRSVDLEEGVLLLRRDGSEIPIGDSAAPIRDRLGQITGTVLVIQDESEKRRVGRRLSYEAAHDALTGLVNRREFERRLTRVLAGLSETPSDQVLLFLDLDRFKAVNDLSGHDAGDALLQHVSTIMGSNLRKHDTLARVGGDEFCILLENCPPADGERIAEGIRSSLDQLRFDWDGQVHSLTASIGLVAVTADNAGLAAALHAGDAASYKAKLAGGNRVHISANDGAKSPLALVTERRTTGRSPTTGSHPIAHPNR